MTPKTNPKTVCHSKRGKENVDSEVGEAGKTRYCANIF